MNSSFTVLVVEDDTFLRDIMVRKLRETGGYEVIESTTAEEGLDAVKERKPDLVLLDLILPGMDGFHFLECVKGNPATASIPVIILSNFGQKADMERGEALGATKYLIKAHMSPMEIVDEVKRFFEGK